MGNTLHINKNIDGVSPEVCDYINWCVKEHTQSTEISQDALFDQYSKKLKSNEALKYVDKFPQLLRSKILEQSKGFHFGNIASPDVDSLKMLKYWHESGVFDNLLHLYRTDEEIYDFYTMWREAKSLYINNKHNKQITIRIKGKHE